MKEGCSRLYLYIFYSLLNLQTWKDFLNKPLYGRNAEPLCDPNPISSYLTWYNSTWEEVWRVQTGLLPNIFTGNTARKWHVLETYIHYVNIIKNILQHLFIWWTIWPWWILQYFAVYLVKQSTFNYTLYNDVCKYVNTCLYLFNLSYIFNMPLWCYFVVEFRWNQYCPK